MFANEAAGLEPRQLQSQVMTCCAAEKASTSDEEGDEKPGSKAEDGADSAGVTGTDAAMTDAGQTPEPGTTPEPEDKDDKGDALAALLAAGGLRAISLFRFIS